VHVEDGRIRRIEPHSANRATPEGVCLKGLSYYERVRSPDRILRPLYRNRKSGSFEPLSWDDAFDRILEELAVTKRTGGPQSMLYYAGSGTKGLLNAVGMEFWRLWGGCTATYGDLCWPAGLEATRLTLGENKHSVPWDLANARLIVLWGKNAAETNIHQMVFVQKALEAGARLVVIDPRRTETAERANLFIQPRPGTDGALALGVAHLLIDSGRVDREFIERHVSGYSEFAEHVRPATISAGYGMQRYTNSGQTMRALLALLAITGNVGKPGAGWVYANLQSAIFDAVPDPIAFYPPDRPDGVVRVSISTARLGRDMLATADPPLRMAWVERGNPVTQNPETGKVLEAFRGLAFRVVVDQFLTDTAREADLVLPAKTMFEQSDVIGAYWHPYIQLKQKMLEPPGEVKPESEIYRELARRLGFDNPQLSGKIPGSSDPEIESYLEARLAPFDGLTLDRLREGPMPAPGQQEIAFADLVFRTPSGKIELASDEAALRWGADRVPSYSESEESVSRDTGDTRYPLYFMTPNTKNRIHSQFNNLRMIRQFGDRPEVQIHPDDARNRGIDDGDRVRIFNDRGELRVAARLDHGVRPGCIAVTNGWWTTDGGTVNFCSRGRETDMGHGAAFHDNRVEIEPVTDAT